MFDGDEIFDIWLLVLILILMILLLLLLLLLAFILLLKDDAGVKGFDGEDGDGFCSEFGGGVDEDIEKKSKN